MFHIFDTDTRKKYLYASLTSAAAATLLLAGCGSAGNTSTDATPSSTAASSAQDSAAEQSTDNNDTESTEENFEGSEALADAPTVPLDQEQVVATGDLYTQYEGVLSSVETTAADVSSSQVDGGESNEDSPADTGATQLSDQAIAEINRVATGAAAEEFAATALEFGVNGWSQEGSSKIVGEPKVADTTFDGKSAKILEVCVDSSDVTVKDSAGNNLTSSHAKRSLNIFTLIEDNGSWKIAMHDFPNNPDC